MPYTFKHGDRPLEGVTVQRAIGRGGFGEVYYAVMDSGKQVALKYLRENPEIELRGVNHVMNLKSPHLITIYDVRQGANAEPFVLMEYVSGPSLRELMIAEPRGLGVQKAAFFLQGICRGLAYLHERGIVHRDLKPANIFYDDGYVKIGDYGLSKHISVSRHSGQTVSVGTVHYMAPEIGSGNYTLAIDIYALGVILYEMLTGRLPYTGSSMAEVLMRHLRDEPDLSGVPAPFVPVIAKALSKNPSDRYQTADEMLAAVRESADVSAIVDTFDASTLSQAPRIAAGMDADQTLTTPVIVPPPPPLDVRELPQRELPQRLQDKLNRLTHKLEQKAGRLEKKFGLKMARAPQAVAAPDGRRRSGSPFVHSLMLMAVTIGLAIVMSRVFDQDEVPRRAIVLTVFMFGGTFGALLTYFRFLQRIMTRNPLLDRLVYGAVGGLFMLAGYGIATHTERYLPQVIFGPLAALVVCDWSRRIEAGRCGEVKVGSAVMPAIVGLIGAAIGGAEDHSLLAAGVCAGLSLLIQSAAVMWPPERESAPAPGGAGMPSAPPLAGGMPPVPSPAGAGGLTAMPTVAPSARVEAPPLPLEPLSSGVSTQAMAMPSFAGRATNAGLSFLGKLLLTLGLLLAFLQPAVLQQTRLAMEHGLPIDPDLRPLAENGVPPGLVFCSLVAGSMFLVLARRGGDTRQFMRGIVGCSLLLVGGIFVQALGAPALSTLLTARDWSQISAGTWAVTAMRLLPAVVPTVAGAVLLLLPGERRGETIVI